MDHPADVVGRHDVEDRDLARVEVDVDLGHRRRPAEGRIRVAAVGRVVEDDARVRLEVLVDPGRTVGPGVRRVRIARTARRVRSSTTARNRRQAPITRPPTTIAVREATVGPAVGHERRVLGRQLDRLDRHAQGVGRQLGEDRLRALAHLGRAGQDHGSGRRRQLDRGDRGEVDLARAGEARAVPGEGQARRRAAIRAAPARRFAAPPGRPGGGRPAPGPARTRRPRGPVEDLLGGHAARAGPGRSGSRRRAGTASGGGPRAAISASASAIRLTCISAANSVWGAPKPRKAPLGGVLVATTRDRDPDVRAGVRAAGMERAARQDDRGQRAVRPAVHHDLDVLGDEPAVGPDTPVR